jgi:hypothetical protein
MGKFRDISNARFGRLTAVSPIKDNNKYFWICLCDCGNSKRILTNSLLLNKTKSCGCLDIESKIKLNTKHGQGGGKNVPASSEYTTWQRMKARCSKNCGKYDYKLYYGRGIKVCDRWLNSFENFFSDMGKKPSKKHSLDRIDYDDNYEPSNCRWATINEQTRNKRTNILIEYNGIKMIQNDFCKLIGADKGSIKKYLKTKTVDEIVFYYKNRKTKNEKFI